MKNKWHTEWESNEYQKVKENSFQLIDNYIQRQPIRILDIGCGFAFESELFQKKYNSELYLLDGDFDTTADVSRDINYGSVKTFKFYSKINDLKQSYELRNLKYKFVDANNINISCDIKFDLVYSMVSCGFHYPVSTYKNLILDHTDHQSIIIMDIRKQTLEEQLDSIEIVNVLCNNKKSIKAHIRFKV